MCRRGRWRRVDGENKIIYLSTCLTISIYLSRGESLGGLGEEDNEVVDEEENIIYLSVFCMSYYIYLSTCLTISIFLSRGESVGGVGEEDGEVVDEQDKIKYNMEKLIEWPGKIFL